jgi:HSP20 family protein
MSRLIRWNPLSPWLPEEFEKIFEGFGTFNPAGFTPAIDVYQTEGDVVIEAPLPGIDPAQVEVTVTQDVLTIQGHVERKTEVDEQSYYRREVRSGSFHRSVALPAAVEGDRAEASYDKGVLTVRIPKTAAAKPKAVRVRVGQ